MLKHLVFSALLFLSFRLYCSAQSAIPHTVTVLHPTNFNFAPGSSFGAAEDWTNGPYYGTRGTFFANVTGYVRAAVVVNDDIVTVRQFTYAGGASGVGVKGLYGPNEDWTGVPYYGNRGTFFADVDGDGKEDAIVINDDTVTVRRSNGTSFGPNEDWTHGAYYGSRGTFFVDVNGDKKADAIAVNNDKITVRRSNGHSFGTNENWTQEPYYGSRGTFFADINGDGKADAIAVNDDTITVRPYTVSCFIVCWNERFGPNEDWTHGAYYGSRGTFFADVTCDGKADAIVVNDDITVRRSSGTQFQANEQWTNGPFYGDRGTFFADLDGDGCAEAIAVSN